MGMGGGYFGGDMPMPAPPAPMGVNAFASLRGAPTSLDLVGDFLHFSIVFLLSRPPKLSNETSNTPSWTRDGQHWDMNVHAVMVLACIFLRCKRVGTA